MAIVTIILKDNSYNLVQIYTWIIFLIDSCWKLTLIDEIQEVP